MREIEPGEDDNSKIKPAIPGLSLGQEFDAGFGSNAWPEDEEDLSLNQGECNNGKNIANGNKRQNNPLPI